MLSYMFNPRTRLKQAKSQSDTAALVRELRRRLALTQEQFAQKVGVTYSTINHWENGKRAPQPFLLRRLREMKGELDAVGKKSTKEKSG
jgi:DNA-binding XRE family transcriptional regulator